MKRYLSAIAMLVVLCSLAVSGRAMISKEPDVPGIASISPEGHQAIRAEILDKSASRYTIDVEKISNIGVDEEAATFAVYVTSNLPNKCGDFRNLDLKYQKPEKYKRVFNLKDHKEVLKAIDLYGCIVMRNTG